MARTQHPADLAAAVVAIDHQPQPHRAKPGTRPKGPRHAITVRIPEEHFAPLDAARESGGWASMSDYLVFLLARVHELDPPAYAVPKQRGGSAPQPSLDLQLEQLQAS